MRLYGYQAKAKQKMMMALEKYKRVLFVQPMGSGKSVVFSSVVKDYLDAGKKVLLVVNKRILIDQTRENLEKMGIDVNVMHGKNKYVDKKVNLSTIWTLVRRFLPCADLLIIDECHHVKAASYDILWKKYAKARVLGVTATPKRLDGKGFKDVFNCVVMGENYSYLIENGYLCRMKHMVASKASIEKLLQKVNRVKVRRGDYDPDELYKVVTEDDVMGNLVESYKTYAMNKRMVVFAVNVKHSKEICGEYNKAGIKAGHIDARMRKNEIEDVLDKFKSGKIKVLCNVFIVSEGWDYPGCEVVQLARPTKSIAVYLQQVGRAMRICERKRHGMILDNAGLLYRFGVCYKDRYWTLNGEERQVRRKQDIDRENEFYEHRVLRELSGVEFVEFNNLRESVEMGEFESFMNEVTRKGENVVFGVVRFYRDLLAKKGFVTEEIKEYMEKRLVEQRFIKTRDLFEFIENEYFGKEKIKMTPYLLRREFNKEGFQKRAG